MSNHSYSSIVWKQKSSYWEGFFRSKSKFGQLSKYEHLDTEKLRWYHVNIIYKVGILFRCLNVSFIDGNLSFLLLCKRLKLKKYLDLGIPIISALQFFNRWRVYCDKIPPNLFNYALSVSWGRTLEVNRAMPPLLPFILSLSTHFTSAIGYV